MNVTYLVPECNLAELEARVEKLNRRCKRLNVPEITLAKKLVHVKTRVRVLTVDGHINSQCWELPEKIAERNAQWPCQDTGERMAWWSVTISGESPSLNGWAFVAVLEPLTTEDGETLNLIQAVPGQSCPVEFREAVGRCDHCRTHRRRSQTFVVRHESGGHKCVGRNCLKDFLAYHADPHALAGQAELLAELGTLCGSAEDDEWLGGGGSQERAWDLKHFLTLTACRIRLFGWLSRGKAFEDRLGREATADHVLTLLTPPDPRFVGETERKRWEEFCGKHTLAGEDAATADAAIEWARAVPEAERSGESDYPANVNLIARVGVASRKTAGIAASIIIAYQRVMEKEINRQRDAVRPESNWVGEVGKRIECLEVRCEKIICNEGAWGVTSIHKLTDMAGNDLTWFASNSAEWLKEGDTVHITASIKEHSEFRGRKQTIITRLTVLSAEKVVALQAKQERKVRRGAKKVENPANSA